MRKSYSVVNEFPTKRCKGQLHQFEMLQTERNAYDGQTKNNAPEEMIEYYPQSTENKPYDIK